jgi:hypothetical protein
VVTNLARKVANLAPLPRVRSAVEPPSPAEDADEQEDRSPLHWLVTGSLISGAMWAVLIAIIMAAFGNWETASFLFGLAVALIGLLWLAVRRSAPKPSDGDTPPPDQE